jgi:hypothetical protein
MRNLRRFEAKTPTKEDSSNDINATRSRDGAYESTDYESRGGLANRGGMGYAIKVPLQS